MTQCAWLAILSKPASAPVVRQHANYVWLMEQAPDEMVRPGHNGPDFLFEHGLQYGQNWPYRYLSNDFNLAWRIRGRLEPPQPRSARRISAANAFARRVQDTANTPPHRMQGARVVAVVGEFEAAGMAELVAMDVNGILASSRAA